MQKEGERKTTIIITIVLINDFCGLLYKIFKHLSFDRCFFILRQPLTEAKCI